MLLNQAFREEGPWLYIAIVVTTILSVVLHELGHALTATWQGDPTPKIRGHLTWNPVVHMGWFSMIAAAVMGIAWGATPVNPAMFRNRRWGGALVSFAGPAVNIFLALVAALVLHASGDREPDGFFSAFALLFWSVLLYQNVLLFLFNLIPVPPLDGFGVLDEIFDLGSMGDFLKKMSPLPLLIAIVVLNSAAFGGALSTIVRLLAPGVEAR